MVFGAVFAFRAQAAEIDVTVAQSGSKSGIRNHVFTTWLPSGQGFAGLQGNISLTGNAPGFSEALVLLGMTPDDRKACNNRNDTPSPDVPALSRLWAGILKSNDTSTVSVPAAVALVHPIPPAPGGTCLATVVSAGYPYLRPGIARYTTTSVRLTIDTSGLAGGPVRAFGMGGEFRFAPGTAQYVGIEARRPLTVDAIAVSISAAPVAGAPEAARWGPPATQPWQVRTGFLKLPGQACRDAHFASHPAGPDFAVLRLPQPALIAYPEGAIRILDVPLASRAMQAAQTSSFTDFTTHRPPLYLQAGDCLLAWTTYTPDGDSTPIDAENQSTVYLRPTTPAPKAPD